MAMKTGVMTIIRIEQILGIPWRVARPGTRPSYTNQTPLIYFNKNIYVYIYIVLYKKNPKQWLLITLFKFYIRAYKLLQNIVRTVQTKVNQYF